MKNSITIFTRFFIAAAIVLSGGQFSSITAAPSSPERRPGVSAEKNSFNEVTSKLDPGGNLYLYLSTEQVLEGLSGKISGWRNLLNSLPDVKSDDRENIGKAFDLVTHLVHDCGIEDISGFGMSSLAVEKGFYRSKTVLHHYPGKGSGFLWSMFGQKAHALNGLDLCPANSAAAVFADLDIPMLWSVIQKEAAQSGFPQAGDALRQVPEHFEKATGLAWEKVLASLGNEYGFILTLDPEHMITLPLPGSTPLEIPEPGLVLIVKVKDDLIFERVAGLLKSTGQQVISVDEADLKMRTVPVPLPLPMEVRPTLAMSGGYLFLATTDKMVRDIVAVKAGKGKGLKSTPEFARLSKDVPREGNQFGFLSQRFGETIMKVQQQAMQMAGARMGGQQQILQSFFQPGNASVSYSVGANGPEGWVTVANGNQNPGMMVMAAAAIVPVGILAAIAVPNFMKARAHAKGSE